MSEKNKDQEPQTTVEEGLTSVESTVEVVAPQTEASEAFSAQQEALQELEKDVSATAAHREVQADSTVLASQVETGVIGKEVVDQNSMIEATQQGETTAAEAEVKPEEEKNFFEKTWDWTKDNRNQEGRKGKAKVIGTGAGILGGATLLYLGIKKLFGKKDKEEASDGTKKEKSWRGKARDKTKTTLKRVGGGILGALGISAVVRNRDTIKGWFGFGKKSTDGKETGVYSGLLDIQNPVESFEKQATQGVEGKEKHDNLNSLGNKINQFYGDVYKFNDGTAPSGLEEYQLGDGKDKHPGVIPHMLENSFDNIGELNKQKSLLTLWAYGEVAEVQKSLAGAVGTAAGKVALWALSLFGFKAEGTEENIKKAVENFFAGSNDTKEMQIIFRKILKTMSYLNAVENLDFNTTIEMKLKEGMSIYKVSSDNKVPEKVTLPDDPADRKEKLQKIQEHISEYKIGTGTTLQSLADILNFKNQKLSSIIAVAGQTTTTEVLEANPVMKEGIVKLNEKRQKTQESFDTGDKEKKKKVLEQMKGSASDELSDSMLMSSAKYFPILHLFESTEKENLKKQIEESAGYQQMLQEYHMKFDNLVDQLEQGTLDDTAIKQEIDKYYASLKEYYVIDGQVEEIMDKNGEVGGWSVFYRAKNFFTGTYTTITQGVSLIVGGDGLRDKTKGFAYVVGGIATGVAPALRAVNRAMHPTKLLGDAKIAGKLGRRTIKLPYTIGKFGYDWVKAYKLIGEISGPKKVYDARKVVRATHKVNTLIRSGKSSAEAIAHGRYTIEEIVRLRKLGKMIPEAAEVATNTAKAMYEGLKVGTQAQKFLSLMDKADDVAKLTAKIVAELQPGADGMATLRSGMQVPANSYAKSLAEELINAKNAVDKSPKLLSRLGTKMKEAGKQILNRIPRANQAAASHEINQATRAVEEVSQNPTREGVKSLKTFIEKSPHLRAALKRSPFLIDGIVNIFQAYGLSQEADAIKEINVERGNIRSNKAMIVGTIGGVEIAIFAVGVAMSWNPAGWVILAGVAAVEALKVGVNQYYSVVESYYRNTEEFKKEYVSFIKQEIISKRSRSEQIDVSSKEKRQEFVSWILPRTSLEHENKVVRAKITVAEAMRALIYLEEKEYYPNAGVDLNKVPQEYQPQINEENTKIETALKTRFDYIKGKYGDTIISKDKLTGGQSLDALDVILQESREYQAMHQLDSSLSDVSAYKSTLKKEVEADAQFASLSAFYQSSPRACYTIYQMIQTNRETDEDMYLDLQKEDPNYIQIEKNVQYFRKFMLYQTLGKLPSELPQLDTTIDIEKINLFFGEGKLQATTITTEVLSDRVKNGALAIYTAQDLEKEQHISSIIGQNILYRIAKEVIGGYLGGNTLDELKLFFNEDKANTTGIYYNGKSWYVNNVSVGVQFWSGKDQFICDDIGLSNMENVKKLSTKIQEATTHNGRYEMISTDTSTNRKEINATFGQKMIDIINQELQVRSATEIQTQKTKAINYIKEHSKGNYVSLPVDMIADLTRAGVENVGLFYYIYENNQVKAVHALKGAGPDFLAGDKKSGLVDEVVAYETEIFMYTETTQKIIMNITDKITTLDQLIKLNGNDIDLQKDIQNLIAKKTKEWEDFKVLLSHMEPQKSEETLRSKKGEFEQFFGSSYVILLSLASTGSSNDVDTYDDYRKFSQSVGASSLSYENKNGNIDSSVNLPDFEYMKDFTTLVRSKPYPEKNKSAIELLNSSDKNEQQLGRKFCEVLLKSLLESAMLGYKNGQMTSLSNWGSRGVDKKLLEERIAINIKII